MQERQQCGQEGAQSRSIFSPAVRLLTAAEMVPSGAGTQIPGGGIQNAGLGVGNRTGAALWGWSGI